METSEIVDILLEYLEIKADKYDVAISAEVLDEIRELLEEDINGLN